MHIVKDNDGTYLAHHEFLDAQERRKARQCS